jgi:hypothetical protein
MDFRNVLRVVVLVPVIGLLAVGALLFYMGKQDVVEIVHSSFEEATAAGAFADAALPNFLPKSSRNIVSRSNLDSNDSLVTFDFGSDFDQFLKQQKSWDVVAALGLANRHGAKFSNRKDLRYFPLISSETGVYHGSLLVNLATGKAVYVEPPHK